MKTSAVRQLCYWSVGSLALGIALCFPLFSFLPLFGGVGLAVAFGLYFVFFVPGRKASSFGFIIVALIYSGIFLGMVATFAGVERVERHECAWKEGAKGIEVDLRSIGGFGWSHVESAELTERLKHDKPPTVRVDVPVVRDFGHVRARGLIQSINGLPVREP